MPWPALCSGAEHGVGRGGIRAARRSRCTRRRANPPPCLTKVRRHGLRSSGSHSDGQTGSGRVGGLLRHHRLGRGVDGRTRPHGYRCRSDCCRGIGRTSRDERCASPPVRALPTRPTAALGRRGATTCGTHIAADRPLQLTPNRPPHFFRRSRDVPLPHVLWPNHQIRGTSEKERGTAYAQMRQAGGLRPMSAPHPGRGY
jgi:hypothetical protein